MQSPWTCEVLCSPQVSMEEILIPLKNSIYVYLLNIIAKNNINLKSG